jgi:hypothetical protein
MPVEQLRQQPGLGHVLHVLRGSRLRCEPRRCMIYLYPPIRLSKAMTGCPSRGASPSLLEGVD